jgi:hypothetical protein
MFVQRNNTIFESTRKLKGSIVKTPHDDFTPRLRGPMSFDLLEELGRRNQARVKQIIADMGNKWIGHPSRRIQRKEETTE